MSLKKLQEVVSNNLSINCYKLQSYCKKSIAFLHTSNEQSENLWNSQLTIVSKRNQILKVKFNKLSTKHTLKSTKYCWKKLNKTKLMESYSMLIDLKFWCWST